MTWKPKRRKSSSKRECVCVSVAPKIKRRYKVQRVYIVCVLRALSEPSLSFSRSSRAFFLSFASTRSSYSSYRYIIVYKRDGLPLIAVWLFALAVFYFSVYRCSAYIYIPGVLFRSGCVCVWRKLKLRLILYVYVLYDRVCAASCPYARICFWFIFCTCPGFGFHDSWDTEEEL